MTGLSVPGFIVRSVALVAVSALSVAAFVVPRQASADTGPPPLVALTAQTSAAPVGELFDRQIDFHVALAVEFVTTGAQLTERIVAVPDALVRDVRTGTAVPVALRDALVTLADVEFDAGRELIGYARDYADFQVEFATEVLATLPGPLGELVATAGALMSEFVERVAAFAVAAVNRVQALVHDVADVQPERDRPAAPPDVSESADSIPAPTPHRSSAAIAPAPTEPATRVDSPADNDTQAPARRTSKPTVREFNATDTVVRAQGEVRASSTTATDTVEDAPSDTTEPDRVESDRVASDTVASDTVASNPKASDTGKSDPAASEPAVKPDSLPGSAPTGDPATP